jgi:hypothetical protein
MNEILSLLIPVFAVIPLGQLGSRPTAAIARRGNRATSSAQPAASLVTQKVRPLGRIATSKRSIETSIPTL